jgi:hypothetical protein
MKVIKRMELIEDVACTLQAKFTFKDIDIFLAEFGFNEGGDHNSYNSKRIYVKDKLRKISIKDLAKIAEELDIRVPNVVKVPPKNWENSNSAKAFISHISKDKKIAKKLRDVLKCYNIEAFVAHEDIKASEEWQTELVNALNTSDFFVSIHTKGFKDSAWCQQEIGYAIARQVKIIPIKFDEDPVGFIGRVQALIRGKKSAEDVVKEILEIIKIDPLTKEIYQSKVASYYKILEKGLA